MHWRPQQALYSDNVYYYVTGAGCQHESHDPKTLPQTLYVMGQGRRRVVWLIWLVSWQLRHFQGAWIRDYGHQRNHL